MKIRNATGCDMAKIAGLQSQWHTVPTWGFVARSETELDQLDARLIWVVEDRDTIIGYAICVPRENNGSCIYAEHDRVLELDEIYVVPGARGEGFGSKLLERVESQAKRDGFTKPLVYSSVKELDPVLKFYRKNGYQSWYVQLFKDISQDI